RGEKAGREVIVGECEGVVRPDIVLPFDDPELAGCTVGDVLADPEGFEDETLADPLEGVSYGRCVAKIMRRADGTPWIHSFAHGRTTYALKHDSTSVRKAMEKAAKDDVVRTFTLLAASADLDEVELAELRPLAEKVSGDESAGNRGRAQGGEAATGQAERGGRACPPGRPPAGPAAAYPGAIPQ